MELVKKEDLETQLFNATRPPVVANDHTVDTKVITTKLGSFTSGIFIFPADDPDFVDPRGNVSLTRLFNQNAAGEELSPEARTKHLQTGLIKTWPELKQENRKAPKRLLHASGSETKQEELRQTYKFYDINLRLAATALGYTPHDSKEEQPNGAQITQDKIKKSIIKEIASLSTKEREVFTTNLKAKNLNHVVGISDDRSIMLDPAIKQSAVWDKLRQSKDLLIQEAFQDNHDFPGKRMKEIMKACGGPIEFIDMMNKAYSDLDAQGIQISRNVSLGVWMHITPLTPGQTNLPDKGIYLYQQVDGASFCNITQENRLKAANGYSFDVDDFIVPAEYKGIEDKQGNPYTISHLRQNPESNYFSENHAVAQMTHKLMDMLNISTLEEPQNWDPIKITDPKVLFIGGSSKITKNTAKHLAEFNRHTRKKAKKSIQQLDWRTELNSIGDIEEAILKSDAIVFPDHDYTGLSTEETLVEKLVPRTAFDYHIALHHAGSFNFSGCPAILSPQAIIENKHHASFYNWGASGTRFQTVTTDYNGSAGSLARTLNSKLWDKDAYKPHKKRKEVAYNYFTQEKLCEKLKIQDLSELGPICAVFGGATTEHTQALEEAEEFAYDAAKNGLTIFHGGGSRGVMGAFMKGAMRAYKEGYRNFKQVAIRTPIVSAAEGPIKPFIEKHGLDVSSGDINNGQYAIMDDHIHFIEEEAFGVRQDAILRFADTTVTLAGGHGTAYEDDHVNLHNALVELRGYGLLKGEKDYNLKKKDKFIVNTTNPASGNRYFDGYISTLTEEEQKIVNQTVVNSGQEAIASILRKFKEEGRELRAIEKIHPIDNFPTMEAAP